MDIDGLRKEVSRKSEEIWNGGFGGTATAFLIEELLYRVLQSVEENSLIPLREFDVEKAAFANDVPEDEEDNEEVENGT